MTRRVERAVTRPGEPARMPAKGRLCGQAAGPEWRCSPEGCAGPTTGAPPAARSSTPTKGAGSASPRPGAARGVSSTLTAAGACTATTPAARLPRSMSERAELDARDEPGHTPGLRVPRWSELAGAARMMGVVYMKRPVPRAGQRTRTVLAWLEAAAQAFSFYCSGPR